MDEQENRSTGIAWDFRAGDLVKILMAPVNPDKTLNWYGFVIREVHVTETGQQHLFPLVDVYLFKSGEITQVRKDFVKSISSL